MSLDSDIAQLTGAASALIDKFNSKDADIEQRVNAALQAIPKTGKMFYVDQVNGSDTNDGTEASPLKSLKEAITRTPNGGTVDIVLANDYRLAEIISVTNVSIKIRSKDGSSADVSGSQKNLYFDVFESGAEIRVGSIVFYHSCTLHLEFIRLVLPDTAGLAGSKNTSSVCLGPRSSGDAFQTILKLTYSEIVVPADTTYLMGNTPCMFFILTMSLTYPEAMAGKWIRGVGAGTPVSSVSNVIASGITSL